MFDTLPKERLSNAARDACFDWFNSSKQPGFFTASTGEQFGFNYVFEITNEATRICKEIFMLSLVTAARQSMFVEDIVSSTLDERSEKIRSELSMFYSSYPGTKKE